MFNNPIFNIEPESYLIFENSSSLELFKASEETKSIITINILLLSL